MNYRQHLQQAFSNLFSAKLRSFLAVLGILVGTASVVTLVSSGEAATQKALQQFKEMGTDLLAVSLNEPKFSRISTPENTLSIAEAFALKDAVKSVERVAPSVTLFPSISYDGQKYDGVVVGATESYQDVAKIHLQRGHFISYLQNYSRYCVIGQSFYQQFKKTHIGDVIGSQIWLGSEIYTIIGIMKPWPQNLFFSVDLNTGVIIPINSAILVSPDSKLRGMVVKFKEGVPLNDVQNAITDYLRMKVPALKPFYGSPREIIDGMQKQHQIFTLLLGLIGGISLLVGGIGVMNIMLVSVAERRREIGIRKALGARARDIQHLFLSEAIVLSLFGGLLGVMTGITLSFVIAYFAHWNFQLFWLPPILGFSVSAATGVFFGYYPAYRAAQLDPITALRYE